MLNTRLDLFWRLAIVLLFTFELAAVVEGAPRPDSNIKRQSGVPSFVYDYAPIAYLDEQEAYYPSDISQQLVHTTPRIDNVTVAGAPNPLTLDNLDQLNALNGTNIYLTSNEGIEALPAWFKGIQPDASGVVTGGTTTAVVVADKGDYIDVFYFYFYAYNRGNDVDIVGVINLGEYGDHVGDWEHAMLRFSSIGEPQSIWLSQHSSGEAFTYSALEKYSGGLRPVIYVGRGTHANWATTGDHDHTLGISIPVDFLLTDHTSQGPLFDPVQSAYFYTYDNATSTFSSYDTGSSTTAPTAWLYFLGKWGDQQLPDNYPGQKLLFDQPKYSGGPTGPIDKDLGRTEVCNINSVDVCIVSPILTS